MKKQRSPTKVKSSKSFIKKSDLLEDLRNMIDQAKRLVASVVNTHLIVLNWQMGCRIRTEILQEKRADYGKEIVATVSQELTKEYGQGFTISALSRMLKFVELFPDEQICLGWLLLPKIPIKFSSMSVLCKNRSSKIYSCSKNYKGYSEMALFWKIT